jgi:DNA-binding transcriptional LysR family regulator
VALGTLPTVGAYLLPALIQAYHRQHPEVVVRITEALPDALEAGVAGGDLDLAILNLPVRRLDLVAQKLWQEGFVLAVPRGHRLASAKRAVALAEVVGERLVVIPGVAATRALEEACEAAGEAPRISVEVDNPESVRRMVERGLGIALIPALMGPGPEKTGRGFEVVEVARGPRRQVALIHRGEDYLNAAARAMKTLLVQTLRR